MKALEQTYESVNNAANAMFSIFDDDGILDIVDREVFETIFMNLFYSKQNRNYFYLDNDTKQNIQIDKDSVLNFLENQEDLIETHVIEELIRVIDGTDCEQCVRVMTESIEQQINQMIVIQVRFIKSIELEDLFRDKQTSNAVNQ